MKGVYLKRIYGDKTNKSNYCGGSQELRELI